MLSRLLTTSVFTSTLLFLTACAPTSAQQNRTQSPPPAATQERVIPVTAELWKFTPNVLQVKHGEAVILRVTGASGTHGLAIPGLGINEVVIQGQTVSMKIPTDKPGTYDFFCSIQCGSGHSDMKGQIVIEP